MSKKGHGYFVPQVHRESVSLHLFSAIESHDAINLLLFAFIFVFNVLFFPCQHRIKLVVFMARRGVKGVRRTSPTNRPPAKVRQKVAVHR
jgi:hypothetical protein